MTTELVTLAADLPGSVPVPVWLTEVTPGGWNGFHVPVGRAADFITYMTAVREADPHGDEWPVPFVDAAGVLRLPAVDDPDNRDADTTWAPLPDGRFALDGLVWTTPYTGTGCAPYVRVEVSDVR